VFTDWRDRAPGNLQSAGVGLDDGDALRLLRDALDPPSAENDLVRLFYTRWFAVQPSVRDLFPPDMGAQRATFGRAMWWVLGEFIAQHVKEPVAFLAQLGRDHRKYGVTQEHYPTMQDALYTSFRTHFGDRWDAAIDTAAREAFALMCGVMSGAADAESGPGWWDGTVVEHHRVSRDLAVVRLRLDRPIDYHPGQYVNVEIAQCPRRWRYLSPAIPANPEGDIEFHVRAVLGGMVSTAIVGETRQGDRWRLSAPHGALDIDRDGPDVLMVAGSTGLAPLRALIMDMCRFGDNPRVHLFFGARYPCELYDLRTLWEIAAGNPWLSVSPVSDYRGDPPWAADYPDVQPPRGLHVRQTGRLPEIVTRYGAWGDRQILISGGPQMIGATREALIA
jgi:NAD(P)H-flavin reductase/hemoglobin-like flavoprotein